MMRSLENQRILWVHCSACKQSMHEFTASWIRCLSGSWFHVHDRKPRTVCPKPDPLKPPPSPCEHPLCISSTHSISFLNSLSQIHPPVWEVICPAVLEIWKKWYYSGVGPTAVDWRPGPRCGTVEASWGGEGLREDGRVAGKQTDIPIEETIIVIKI